MVEGKWGPAGASLSEVENQQSGEVPGAFPVSFLLG